MKTSWIILATILASTALAVMMMHFPGYDWLNEHSSDILVVRCITNPPTLLHSSLTDPQINIFSIEVITVIKGTNFSGFVSLVSAQWLNQGDNYLIFGDSEKGAFRAFEDFRVIPLGRELWTGVLTNAIAGKSPDERLQILFKRAIDNLDRQIKKEQEEKQRLEGAIR
jgi:hypothetical protein